MTSVSLLNVVLSLNVHRCLRTKDLIFYLYFIPLYSSLVLYLSRRQGKLPPTWVRIFSSLRDLTNSSHSISLDGKSFEGDRRFLSSFCPDPVPLVNPSMRLISVLSPIPESVLLSPSSFDLSSLRSKFSILIVPYHYVIHTLCHSLDSTVVP